jgi:GNAT superfamily N-acetyltransferase
MPQNLDIKFSRKKHSKFAKEISEASFHDSHLWARDEKSIRKSLKKGWVVLATSKNKLVGWLVIQKLSSGWIRFNTVYVKKDFRRKGVAKKLIRTAITANPKKKIYVSVSNKKFANTLKKFKFKPKNPLSLPFKTLIEMFKEAIHKNTLWRNLKLYTKHKIFNLVKEDD